MRKFQEKYQEKATNLENPSVNSIEHRTNLKHCVQTTAEEIIGYKENKNIKKPWVTGKMLEKMEERTKWKNINTEEVKGNYRKLNNELRRETNKAKEEWTEQKCEEIEELERKGMLRILWSQGKCWRRWKKEENGRISTQKKPKETTEN